LMPMTFGTSPAALTAETAAATWASRTSGTVTVGGGGAR
jgi:hypothetical protein